ncbi:uncharacterized protein LOC113762043 isoform X1 [Coffea eugenioides]|uniref:Uncharacterized protein isoform X3 n=1 Tax=Coffea arabica TaxID=13443 RepID=A0A6P6WLG9_COFAR|nr:uncharacterized protein LOC113732781 isoform X2 [Coffea arabica]XP_027161088.1 uncharacterized protein LOC113762043 isoform X1 [Coffea eugenioides]
MAMSTFLLCLSPKPPQNPISRKPISPLKHPSIFISRRLGIIFTTTSLSSVLSLALQCPQIPPSSAAEASSTSFLSGIANTKSWFQFYGDGFAIRVPPQFEDILEPEDYNAGLSLYGDKAKPKTFAARFASPDGSEVLSVVIRPSNQLKITFLEAKDVTDLGSIKEAAKIFVPGGATLYSARTIKIKEDEGFRTYYFYEFGSDEQHVALVAAVNSGKAIIAGATAPQHKWNDDGVKLRSAAVSLTVL